MSNKKIVILGAGVTGLAAGIKTGASIYEANSYPGGLCHSYIKNDYYFEKGGGRWIFGTDKKTLKFINSLSPLKYYQRKSAVFFPKEKLYIPYPLQNHLSYLPKRISQKALYEMKKNNNKKFSPEASLADWLTFNFGKTLCQTFFFPLHQLYTAGLYTQIAPQDTFKTPVNKRSSGYNQTFAYPKKGLSDLIKKMAKKCKINYNKKVKNISLKKKEIFFTDGSKLKYQRIISTLPLSQMIKIAKITINETPLPYNSIMVVNIGAKKGKNCPSYHWLYTPKNKPGFYRVGFYSNVENPLLLSPSKEKVKLYVEKAFVGGETPSDKKIKKIVEKIIKELQDWQFIKEVEVVDVNWIETAYTWSLPNNSKWREKALKVFQEENIWQIGRYGRWQFQGVLESIKEGLNFL